MHLNPVSSAAQKAWGDVLTDTPSFPSPSSYSGDAVSQPQRAAPLRTATSPRPADPALSKPRPTPPMLRALPATLQAAWWPQAGSAGAQDKGLAVLPGSLLEGAHTVVKREFSAPESQDQPAATDTGEERTERWREGRGHCHWGALGSSSSGAGPATGHAVTGPSKSPHS